MPFFKSLVLAAAALGSAVAAAPGDVLWAGRHAAFSPEQVQAAGRVLYAPVQEPAPRYPVGRVSLLFESTDEQGRPIRVRAQLFVPRTGRPGRAPLYVMGAGTTGLAPHCTPFNEEPERQSWGWYQGHMLSYAAQGLVGVLPEYAGFFEGGPQPYFVSASEGRVLLDAARAAARYLAANRGAHPVQPAPHVFFSGYSQGGHSSFAAADLWRAYAPELPVSGLAVFGATTDVQTLLRENAMFGPYLLAAYRSHYGPQGLDLNALLRPGLAAGLPDNALSRCVGDLAAMYSPRPEAVYSPALAAALRQGRLQANFPRLAGLLARNNAGLNPAGARVPAFVAQGLADDIVTPAAQRRFVAGQCRLGRRVTFREYPGVNHYYTRQHALEDALAWMRAVSSGQAPVNTCG